LAVTTLDLVRNCKLEGVLRNVYRGRARSLYLEQPDDGSGRNYTYRGFIETNSLFVHIPKAAGVSVNLALYGNLAGGHRTMRTYQRVFRKSTLDRMFKFSFVRNPWDRVYSAYNFMNAGGWGEWDVGYREKFLVDCKSFEQFVMEVLPLDEARNKPHFWPTIEFLRGRDGKLYPFDFIGRFESFAADFDKIRSKVNPQAVLEHRNKTEQSDGKSYRDFYSNEMIDMVQSIYHQSIDALGYTFDGFSEKVPFLTSQDKAKV
jgi:hypothetical protein